MYVRGEFIPELKTGDDQQRRLKELNSKNYTKEQLAQRVARLETIIYKMHHSPDSFMLSCGHCSGDDFMQFDTLEEVEEYISKEKHDADDYMLCAAIDLNFSIETKLKIEG